MDCTESDANCKCKARELFEDGYGCAEAVLMAAAAERGIASELIPRIATGFCGGVSRCGGMCGAASGGVMVIGLFHGRVDLNQSRDACYERVQKFLSDFQTRFGSINCKDLTGCDLSTPEGREYFKTHGVSKKCAEYTETAVESVLKTI